MPTETTESGRKVPAATVSRSSHAMGVLRQRPVAEFHHISSHCVSELPSLGHIVATGVTLFAIIGKLACCSFILESFRSGRNERRILRPYDLALRPVGQVQAKRGS